MMIVLRAFQTSVQGSYEHDQFSSHIIVFLLSCSARGALSTSQEAVLHVAAQAVSSITAQSEE